MDVVGVCWIVVDSGWMVVDGGWIVDGYIGYIGSIVHTGNIPPVK